MQNALKMIDDPDDPNQLGGTRLSRHLKQQSLRPYLYKDKENSHYSPLVFYNVKQRINGYEATILIDIGDAILQARKELELGVRQKIIADQCEILARSQEREQFRHSPLFGLPNPSTELESRYGLSSVPIDFQRGGDRDDARCKIPA